MRIVVLGGTGVIGRHVVEAARLRGHDPLAASRSTGVDAVTGVGLAAAIDGADAVVDAVNVASIRRSVAMAYFEAATRQVMAAARERGVAHVVVVSIVGVDSLRAMGYYDAKVTQERRYLAGPVNATVLRATQFHEFALQVAARSSFGPVALVPAMPVQTVAARAVASEVLDAIERGPWRGRLSDVAGPAPASYLHLRARAALARARPHVRVVGVPLAGRVLRPVRDGSLLPAADATIVGESFEAWLEGADGPKAN